MSLPSPFAPSSAPPMPSLPDTDPWMVVDQSSIMPFRPAILPDAISTSFVPNPAQVTLDEQHTFDPWSRQAAEEGDWPAGSEYPQAQAASQDAIAALQAAAHISTAEGQVALQPAGIVLGDRPGMGTPMMDESNDGAAALTGGE